MHTVDSKIMSIQFPHASFGKYVKEEHFSTGSSCHQQPARWGKHTTHYAVQTVEGEEGGRGERGGGGGERRRERGGRGERGGGGGERRGKGRRREKGGGGGRGREEEEGKRGKRGLMQFLLHVCRYKEVQ